MRGELYMHMQYHMPKDKHQPPDGDRQLPIFSAHVPDLLPDLQSLNRCARVTGGGLRCFPAATSGRL
jgi:hypothetical protein